MTPEEKKVYAKAWYAKNKEKHKKLSKRWRAENRDYSVECAREWRAKNRKKVLESREKYRVGHKKRINERSRERWVEHRGEECRRCRVYSKKWRLANLDRARKRESECGQRTKFEVLLHYSPLGSTVPKCGRCGVSDLRVLTLDHVDGSGGMERKQHPNRIGKALYGHLRAVGYPTNFQTLCFNCNWIKRFENHEAKGRRIF
jgi:hypothetical protein